MEEINSVDTNSIEPVVEEINSEDTNPIEPVVEETPLNLTIINFSFETEFGKFADALVFQEGEFETYTEQQIEEMKQTRLTNWLNYIKSTQVKG